MLKTLHCTNQPCYKTDTFASDQDNPFVQSKQLKRDIRFSTRNVRSLCRSGSLSDSCQGIRYRLDLMGVQEVRWDKGCTVRVGDYIFFYGKGN